MGYGTLIYSCAKSPLSDPQAPNHEIAGNASIYWQGLEMRDNLSTSKLTKNASSNAVGIKEQNTKEPLDNFRIC